MIFFYKKFTVKIVWAKWRVEEIKCLTIGWIMDLHKFLFCK